MNIKIIDFVKKLEGTKLCAYKDSGGVWTIGCGHTEGVKKGDCITQLEANKFLATDLTLFNNAVKDLCGNRINEEQSIALTSFAFNVGINAFANSTMLKMIQRNENPALEFLKWTMVNHKFNKGLRNRRLEEMRMFLSNGNSNLQPLSFFDNSVVQKILGE